MNLFIIGNGFDRAHNIQSSYKSFKDFFEKYESNEFVEETCQEFVCKGYRVYEPQNGFNVIQMAIDRTGNDVEWKCFEETLGLIDFHEVLLEKGSNNEQFIREENHRILSKLLNSINEMKDVFAAWTNRINIDALPKEDFVNLISTEDLVLNFNYTKTLERVYGICNNVYHIHGTDGMDIVVGHGNKEVFDDYIEDIYPGSIIGLNQIRAELRKRVEVILRGKQMQGLLKKIKSERIDKVFTYGFSYSDVDLPYIEEICKCLSRETVWYFHDYSSEEDRRRFKDILKKRCNFYGDITTFHIE